MQGTTDFDDLITYAFTQEETDILENVTVNADRNASLVIGQRLVARYQKSSKEKPPTPLDAERVEQSTGVVISQDAQSAGTRPSNGSARHGDHNEHGTAQETGMRMVEPVSDIAYQLRLPF